MKKLTRKNLDELVKSVNVIAEAEQGTYWGMFNNDCFWRCVAYMQNGLTRHACNVLGITNIVDEKNETVNK